MNKAFTISEAMIVVAIICIIAAIVIPNFIESKRIQEAPQATTPSRFTVTDDLLKDSRVLLLYQLADSKTGRQWLVVRTASGTAITEIETPKVEK